MKTIIICATLAFTGFFVQNLKAQVTSSNPEIILLEEKREQILEVEKQALREEVEAINEKLDAGEIDFEEAQKLKAKAAEKRARNIENKLAIVDNKIELIERNAEEGIEEDDSFIHIFSNGKRIRIGENRDRVRKYDRRTYSSLVVAIGLNNAIIKGQSLDDSPYKVGGSRFFELGWAWKTRVFDNSNWLRLKYGFSFQFNGLKPDDNQYFVEEGNQTVLDVFPIELDKSKFRMDNLVFPLHFEIGTSKKIKGENYVRYSTNDKFKLGFGGYAGINLLTIQKLKYNEGGNDKKDKLKRNYNTNNFIYGLSGYVALGDVAVYLKYDLNAIFKDNPTEQRNVSLGVRFDMD